MSSAPSSLEAAFRDEATGGALAGIDADPEQLDLLRDENGRLPSNVFRLLRAGKAVKTGPGRRAGSRNKRNKQLAKLICQQHGDPVMFMASVYATPLDQLVEMLRIADNSAEREEQLVGLIGRLEEAVARIIAKGAVDAAVSRQIDQLVDRLIDVAKLLQVKPGELALRALATQVTAARETAPYVHGKQPISVDVTGKVDGVLIIPGINAPAGVDHGELKKAIDQGGLDRLDFEGMRILPPVEEAEFEDAAGDDEGEAE